MHTFIIAEAGANHNRDLNIAYSLIDKAKEAGADAVKFQTYSSETLYAKNTPRIAGYDNINQLIKDIELPREWQSKLKHRCDLIGIEFMSTPFDENAIEELVQLGAKRLKVAGFESTDMRFLRRVALTKLPLIVSVGIGSDEQMTQKIVETCREYGCGDLTLLHCNNAYPTPVEDINLLTIPKIHDDFEVKVGLSDHTESTLTPALAVALGAKVIEKHFTLARNMKGPDHPFAMEPHELKTMVANIRYAEKGLTLKTGAYTNSELIFKKAGRSLVVTKDLRAGDTLTEDNTTTKRPFLDDGIHASEYYEFLGKRLKYPVPADTPLKLGQVQL